MQNLAKFIAANRDRIAASWEMFAASLEPERRFGRLILVNDIQGLLTAILAEMGESQSENERQRRSEGLTVQSDNGRNFIRLHVASRVEMELSLPQFVSEFRALRATILRLWQEDDIKVSAQLPLEELIRFNEAVDQMIAEGIVSYTAALDQSRELFLGILGHDLKNPLAAISGLAQLMLRPKNAGRQMELSAQILLSATRMQHMITDLLELARLRFGQELILTREPVCLATICQNVINEFTAIYPNRPVSYAGPVELNGLWDQGRMTQLLSNLVSNAMQHGAPGSPVTMALQADDTHVEISVHNDGGPIDPALIPKIFDSFYRIAGDDTQPQTTNLGLGLYICKQIISAHDGDINVRSSEAEGTTFIARVPFVRALAQASA